MGGDSRDATSEGNPMPSAFAPPGSDCPAGPFGSPLPTNRAVTLVKDNVGGDENEGPLWVAAQKALFIVNSTSYTGGRIYKYTPADNMFTVWKDNTVCGGLALDPQGMMVGACHDRQRLSRFDLTNGTRTDVAGGDMYMGKPFNQTNDLVTRGDGNIYFTDTDYQKGGRAGQETTAYYRLSPAGQVTRIGAEAQPNGISLSPDGKILYVASSANAPLKRHMLADDGSAGPAITMGNINGDGMGVDCAGNLYLTANGGIRVLSPDGMTLGMLTGASSGFLTNSAFGDDDRKTLYITTSTALYKIRLNVPGLPN